ncbi:MULTISPECIES: hypothetical protein [Lysinibacillus]|uniref:hypothetical protein n=1 Tax=Lysinibacillus TaxID=400634 RepID=UPI0006AFC825|nr:MULTISPECIES: hypothetical protein [Lysinibacillus]KOS64451.1 hypothetical protein AN161_02540 [Lysinibacillus sp. FJAT-14222]
MHSKYSFLLVVSLFCLYNLTNNVTVSAAEKDVALIYATSNQQLNQDVQTLYEMLKGYTKVDVMPIEAVHEKTLHSYNRIVVISSHSVPISKEALLELNQFQGPAVVIGENVLQLERFAQWQEGDIIKLRAIGEHVLENPIEWKSIQPSSNSETVEVASTLNNEYPFIVKAQRQNWSYIGKFIYTNSMQYEWPSIINRLLQLPEPIKHQTFIVLTDINMETDVAKLQSVVTQFTEKGIPISLEVTPIDIAEDGETIYYLHNNKKLFNYLQKLQKEGFPFILSTTSIQAEKSLDYLAFRGIYPILINGNSTIFTGIVQQGNNQIYQSQNENQTIYPLTVENIADTKINPLFPVEQKIKLLLKAPGSIIGIPYPVYLDASYVQELVGFLKGQPQLDFLDFRKTKQEVKTNHISITQTENGEQNIKLSFSNTDRLKILFEERPFELVLWMIVLTVSMFVMLFFINTFRLRITLRKRLFEERKTNG